MWLVRFFFGDLHIKIIAVLVAAILWFYAVLERNHTIAYELPISVGKVPSGMVVAIADTPVTHTQLAGKGRDLLLLRLRHPAFRLNLANENAGRARVKLTQDQTNLPASVQLVSAKPDFINVDLDQQARRPVKVNVPLRGKPARGFVATTVRPLAPVYLTGPQEDINLYSVVSTESLTLSDLNGSSERTLRLLSPGGTKFRVEPESIAVGVTIESEQTRVFAGVSLTVLKPAQRGVTVRPTTAQIAVSGPAGAVKGLTLQDISATLKLTDTIPKGRRRMPIEITLPPGITLVKCEPALFDVEIR
jgi:YbbR domain-containing protein